MEQVVVTGTRTRKMLTKSPILTKVVTNVELQEAGAVTALDAIEYSIPGVQFSPDAHGDNLQIQGLDNGYILVLVDGQRMVGETRGNVNFDRLNVSEIKRIEIVNGASSVLYGSNAIGAIINIITNDDSYLKPIQASIGSRYSANNEWLLTSNVGFSKDKFSIFLSGFRSSTDGYDLTPESPASYTVNKHIDYSAKIRLGYKINEKIAFSANSTYYQHETMNPPKSTKSTHDLNKDYIFGIKAVVQANQKHTLELKGNTDIYNAFTIYETKNDSINKDSDYSFSSAQLIDVYKPFERLEIIGGAEANSEKIYSLDLFGEREGIDKNAYDLNAFLQFDYSFLKNFEAVIGARYTYHSLYGNHFNPAFSILYSPGNFKFRGNIANGYKSPSLKELYYNFNHHGMFMIYGNPDLKPENAIFTSLSAEYTRKTFNVSLTAFINSIDDKIESVDRINNESEIPLEKYYVNIGETLIQGVETSVSFYIIKNLLTKTSYVYTNAEDKATGLQLWNNSKHAGTFALTYKMLNIKYPFSISLNGRAASGKMQEESVIETDEVTGEDVTTISKYKTDPYALWKLTYNQQFVVLKRIKTQIQLGINNIFDFTDNDDLAVIDPGRRVYAGIKIIF